jgi:PucR-like helix-turn-helix protein/diguanylate cyclase with GGDEF domain
MRTTRRDDWQQVVELCEIVTKEVPEVVPGIITRIRAASPDYAGVPREDHEKHVSEQFRGLLDGLAARRPPTTAQTEAARELGRQRARQGVRVEEMIGAYHVGYREMWNVLLARADAHDPQLTVRLVRLVDLVWTWIRLISSASADAYAEVLRSQHAVQITLAHRFLEILHAGEEASGEAAHLAHALAFDPDEHFQAVCFGLPAPSETGLDQLRQRLGRLPGTVHLATRGSYGVVLCQATPADTVTATVREALPGLGIGVGLRRRGLAGAESSIVDAQRALAVAGGEDVVLFAEEWLPATLLTDRRRLEPLLRLGADVAAAHPHLARAVLGYAENGFSVTATARKLNLHPNTVKYRLDRWTQLTGWDPRVLRGLLNSWLSLRMSAPEPSRTGRAAR